MKLIDVFIEGAMRAAHLHAKDRGITVDADVLIQPLRNAITDQYLELMKAVAEGEAAGGIGLAPEYLLRDLTNAHCNMAAVKALKAAGYITEGAK